MPVEGASKLVTYDEKSPLWNFEWGEKAFPNSQGRVFMDDFLKPEEKEVIARSFVRLRPPSHVTPEGIERVRKWLKGLGASVKVEAPRRQDAVPRDAEVVLPKPHRRAREVVEELLTASHTDAKEELTVFVRLRMDEAKL